jgi:hypothetical protein
MADLVPTQSVEHESCTFANGEAETMQQVAARLSDREHPERWNPNPTENAHFDWWAAIKKARVKNIAHLDRLVAAFPAPDYREVELLTRMATMFLETGDWNAAKRTAEKAIARAKDGSWHPWFDGAQKRIAFDVFKRIEHADGVSRGREQFFHDLAAGKLNSSYLMSDIGETLGVLEIDWPAAQVRAAVDDYLDHVLAANQQVPTYRSFDQPAPSWSVDQALCRVIAYFLAFPVIDVAVAARRVLARFIAADGGRAASILANEPWWDPVQLEYLLSAIHVGSQGRANSLDGLQTWIQGLNASESVAVRSIAKRICDDAGWRWADITTRPPDLVIVLPVPSQSAGREDDLLLDRDVATAWDLHGVVRAYLEKAGLDREEVRSEFERIYLEIGKEYLWSDDERLKRWMKLLLARFRLNPRAILGREAAMRVFGRRLLSGQVPTGAEALYDRLYPIYDPSLEMSEPTERPAELRGMEWRITVVRGMHGLKARTLTNGATIQSPCKGYISWESAPG